MPIPTIGAVPTPPGFQVTSAESRVLMTWNPTPLATIFYLSRSTDAVTFQELGTTTLLQYLDASDQSKIRTVADVAGSLAGHYFLMQSQAGTYKYAFWFRVSGVGTAPVVSGYTAKQVTISNNDSANTIATALAAVIAAQTGFSASIAAADIVTTTLSTEGQFLLPVDGSLATGFLFTNTVIGTIYYYYVQAGNGTNASPVSPTGSGISLLPGQTTVANLRLLTQQECDKVNSVFYTTQEWNSYLNNSYKELYDILIQKFGDDYEVATPYSYTTDGSAQLFPLPSDFYKLLGAEIALNPNDPNSWVTLRKFMFIQRNRWNYPNVYTYRGVTNLRYRLNGSNLMIVPVPGSNQTIRIWYAPRPNQLLLDTQVIDGISGWEEYVVVDAAIKALGKEESDTSLLERRKAALLKRIEEAAENRDVGEPETVSDSKSVNFGWGDDGSFGGENGGAW